MLPARCRAAWGCIEAWSPHVRVQGLVSSAPAEPAAPPAAQGEGLLALPHLLLKFSDRQIHHHCINIMVYMCNERVHVSDFRNVRYVYLFSIPGNSFGQMSFSFFPPSINQMLQK